MTAPQNRSWVNVTPGGTPPVGAPRWNAEVIEEWEAFLLGDVKNHLDATLTVHGGTVIYSSPSDEPPANPPSGLHWFMTDLAETHANTGTPVSPVWQPSGRDPNALYAHDALTDHVISGLLPPVPSPASLTVTVPPGAAYIVGRRNAPPETALLLTASSDTYADLDKNGVYHLTAVAAGAAAPAVYADSIRLFKAVTSATVVTSVSDLRNTTPLLKFEAPAANHPAPLVVTADHTATNEQRLILVDATGGPVTVTLPTAVGRVGREFVIKKTNASATAVTVDPTGSETVDGLASVNTTKQFDAITVESDNANWWITSAPTVVYGA